MDRKDLVKRILELSLELKDAEGVQAMICITDMENAVKDYEKQLRLYSVSQQRELLKAFGKWYNGCTLSNPINMKNIDNYLNSLVSNCTTCNVEINYKGVCDMCYFEKLKY